MARTARQRAPGNPDRFPPQGRRATVVHDGSAFELAADLRQYGFQVNEGPLLSSAGGGGDLDALAVLATRPGAARRERLRERARELCWRGAPVLAIGAAVGPVAELFGSIPNDGGVPRVSGRLADIQSLGRGLFSGLPSEFRLALSSGYRFETTALSAEFRSTAWSLDGELIGASHVFRPVHLLHTAALESRETRSIVLQNLLTMLRERNGRAF